MRDSSIELKCSYLGNWFLTKIGWIRFSSSTNSTETRILEKLWLLKDFLSKDFSLCCWYLVPGTFLLLCYVSFYATTPNSKQILFFTQFWLQRRYKKYKLAKTKLKASLFARNYCNILIDHMVSDDNNPQAGQNRPLPKKDQDTFRQLVRQYETKQYKKGIKSADSILKKFPRHGETLCMKGLILNCMSKGTEQRDEAIGMVKLGLMNDMRSVLS